jgi:hypothetical protein
LESPVRPDRPVDGRAADLVVRSGTEQRLPRHVRRSSDRDGPRRSRSIPGRFGPGRLDAWTRSSTLIAGTRGIPSLEADDTRQHLDAGSTNVLWLERVGHTYALSASSSVSLGVRRIVGTPRDIFAAAPPGCTTAASIARATGAVPCTGAWNLAFAYHHRSPHDDLYVGYGDARQLSTTPSFILKLVHYFGAEKGT